MNETIIPTILNNNLISAILGAMIGGTLTYLATNKLYIKQQQNELKYIATTMKNHFIKLNKSELHHYGELYKNKENESIIGRGIPLSPLYLDTDLYFEFKHDISKFDEKLSKEIYEFYIDLIAAEKHRNYINEHKNIKEYQAFCDVYYENMKENIIKCSERIPKIISLLETTYAI